MHDFYKCEAPKKLRVGFTEAHGMAHELSKFPPSGVEYSFLQPIKASHRVLKSPIKGYFGHYETADHELIEAVLSPIFTKNRWLYSLANFHEAMAFNFFGIPLPRAVRFAFIRSLLMRDNFIKLIFWSQAGKDTLREYGCADDAELLKKTAVVYPAVRRVSDSLINFNKEEVNLLFSGDFFRKGGVNVLDSFEALQKRFTKIKLLLCCDETIDFNTTNTDLKNYALKKIYDNKSVIMMGRVKRDKYINDVLPVTDIYLLPTYAETFGFAVLEAMAYGIPVVSTNIAALPEMVKDKYSGLMVDVSNYDCERMFKGYVVNDIPSLFRDTVTCGLTSSLSELIASADMREFMGRNGLAIARKKFSFEERNSQMLKIYRDAV